MENPDPDPQGEECLRHRRASDDRNSWLRGLSCSASEIPLPKEPYYVEEAVVSVRTASGETARVLGKRARGVAETVDMDSSGSGGVEPPADLDLLLGCATETFHGRMDTQHAGFGARGLPRYNDLLLLAGESSSLFTGAPFRSGLFEFTFRAKRLAKGLTDRRWGSFVRYKILHATWLPVPLDDQARSYLTGKIMAAAERLSEKQRAREHEEVAGAFLSVLVPRFSENARQVLREVLLVLAATCSSVAEYVAGPEFALYFLADECHYLCAHRMKAPIRPCYPTRVVTRMGVTEIGRLYHVIKTEPHRLCVPELHTFHYNPSLVATAAAAAEADKFWGTDNTKDCWDDTKSSVTSIPDLDCVAYYRIWLERSGGSSSRQDPLRLCDLALVDVYHTIRLLTFAGKHSCVDKRVLFERMRHKTRYGDESTDEALQNRRAYFEQALDWLEQIGSVVIEKGHDDDDDDAAAVMVTLKMIWMYEAAIAICFRRLLVVVPAAHPHNEHGIVDPRDPSSVRSKRGLPLCSEQSRAFEIATQRPSLLVNGKAGSGKSDFLSAVASRCGDQTECLGTAFMARNAGDLQRMFPGRSFTLHKVLHVHALECRHGFPEVRNDPDPDAAAVDVTSKLGWSFERCPLENIRLWVIDEMGTVSLDIFAKLFAALTSCGRLEKLIMCGDCEQLPSIKTGNLIRDIFRFLGQRGMTIEFDHVHRVNEGARLLALNANAIRAGRPGDVKFDGTVSLLHPFMPRGSEAGTQAAHMVHQLITQHALGEYEHHVIVYENSWRDKINAHLEQQFNAGTAGAQDARAFDYVRGRKIAFSRNEPRRAISNGEILVLKNVFDVRTPKETSTGGSQPELAVDDLLAAATVQSTRFQQAHTGQRMATGFSRFITVQPLCSVTTDMSSMQPAQRELEEQQTQQAHSWTIPWDKWTRQYIRHANATTIHSYQGNEVQTLVFVLPPFCPYITRSAIYTALTRATRKTIVLAGPTVLRNTILRPDVERGSLLASRIAQLVGKAQVVAKAIDVEQPQMRLLAQAQDEGEATKISPDA